MPVLHPFLTGRLARWMEMEKRIEKVLERGDIWFAPVEEIANYARDYSGGIRKVSIDLQ